MTEQRAPSRACPGSEPNTIQFYNSCSNSALMDSTLQNDDLTEEYKTLQDEPLMVFFGTSIIHHDTSQQNTTELEK